jgi:hypothetical protein
MLAVLGVVALPTAIPLKVTHAGTGGAADRPVGGIVPQERHESRLIPDTGGLQ